MHIRSFSFFTALLAFALLMIGAIVHNTGSALSCPEWPLCYVAADTSAGLKSWISIGHRSMASVVGLFTIIIGFLAGKAKSKGLIERKTFILSMAAIALVLLQGLMGAITVHYELPTLVSTFHLLLSLIFFSVLIKIYYESPLENAPIWSVESIAKARDLYNPSYRDGIHIVLFLIFIQVIFGGILRHTGAGLSCGTSVDQGILCQPVGTSQWTLWPSLASARFHMVHRLMAYVTGFAVFWQMARMLRIGSAFSREKLPQGKTIVQLALALMITIGLQVVVGYQAVRNGLALIPTTLHLALGVVALAIPWWMSLELKSLEDKISPSKPIYSFFRDLIELTKLRLGLLVMATVFVGMMLSADSIGLLQSILGLILITMVVASATSLNCYIEREVDKYMERTKDRALPSGRMNPKVALVFGWTLFAISIPALWFLINPATAVLGLIAHLVYLYAYTPMKRKSPWAVYVGAIPGAIPPVMGWTMISGSMDSMAWSLFAILFIWQIPHFMAISIYYAKDYEDGQIFVYPNTNGRQWTDWAIFIWTVILFATSLSPIWISDTTFHFQLAAILLNVAFTILSLGGIVLKLDDAAHKAWARIYFFGSIIWLPLLLGAMIFLRR